MKFLRKCIEVPGRVRSRRNLAACRILFVGFCVLFSKLGYAQTTFKQSQRTQESELLSTRNDADNSPGLDERNFQRPLLDLTVPQLKQVVKVVFDRETNLIVLIGSRQDIENVKKTIQLIDSKLDADPDPITEKVRLKFQLADTVSGILSNSTALEGTGLQVRPVHFPEAVLLTGRSAIVERAKSIISEIDSHPLFER